MRRASLVVILCAACGGEARAPGKPEPTQPTPTEVELSRKSADFVTGHLAFRPTLGIELELRADWQRAHPGAAIGAFHDELLSYGEAPLPVTRRLMLGAAAGPPLRGR